MNTAVSVLALLVALGALVVALGTWRTVTARSGSGDVADLPQDALGLRHEVAALRGEAATALKHLAVVRYDAFGAGLDRSSGGHLSWSLALLDDHGDGAVLTSIHGRNEARAYAKSITAWRSDQPLSPEEEEAVGHARRT
ncbi:DUF4446 family protein [Nocardioides pocheonensis]|uniref:DUF4446 family protein n=1 Tax=Nocardioides pocheonensis TaxID=661485 RepID=A0A3N0GJU3_9ACTN|nr:DUF4446 family protein [Nocardioides pocheonensis]RNM12719.1 DUF4446 family protein [Nocardioides pocheonensis]